MEHLVGQGVGVIFQNGIPLTPNPVILLL